MMDKDIETGETPALVRFSGQKHPGNRADAGDLLNFSRRMHSQEIRPEYFYNEREL